jgi:hypothetical protein
MNMTFTFKTREEYLTYKAQWKAQYFEVSQNIRNMRAAIMAEGEGTSSDWYNLRIEQNRATYLLEERKASKVEAGIQREARLQEAA